MFARTPNAHASTLWTMRHDTGVARCTLTANSRSCRLELSIDRGALQIESCDTPEQALAIAESWKARLLALGWRDVATALRETRDAFPHNRRNGRG
jgi:hypothetical protein